MNRNCKVIQLPVKRDIRGALAFVEIARHLAFEVKREFHLFSLKLGVSRGGHAHKVCHQFMIAMNGSFCIRTNDGRSTQEWILNLPDQGLLVPPGHWVDLIVLSDDSVLSVLASHEYDETDYIRDLDRFLKYVHSS